jgi:hypothetical protein
MNRLRNTPISIAHLLRTNGLRNQSPLPKEKGIAHLSAQLPFSHGAGIAQTDCALRGVAGLVENECNPGLADSARGLEAENEFVENHSTRANIAKATP